MDYNYLQGTGLEVPVMEERNLCSSASAFGSFQHLAYNPRISPMSWSTTDPTVLQMSEQPWFNRVKMGPVGNIGVDADGNMIYQRPNAVTHHSQQNIPMDMMMATIPGDPFSFGGDVASHAQWNAMQLYSLSSDEYFNDTMPQLISESAAQQPCMYTSSSDCLNETDSSCSSEKDRPLSTSCLVGSSSDELNWRNSDVLQGNLGGSVTGFPLDELPDDSSSIAADVDTQDLNGYALSSIIRMPGPAGECLPLGPVSWMAPSAVEVGSCSKITSVANQHLTIDPLVESVSMRSNGVLPYKRQRACYTMESIPSRPFSQPLIPSLSQRMSSKTSRADLAYPMASLNIADALRKDHVSRKQTPYLPKPAVHEVVRGFGSKRDLLDHDSRSQRKQNATSIEPQSVAARHRRKKISERVRVLEKLIPGGNKMDTASMLDESIEYVKFLQLQVQLLESLVDISEGDSTTSSPSLCKENIDGGKDGLATRISSFGSHASQSCGALHQGRPAASPLILSEILQQQLFKQKLCLVSLRQCPPANRCLASGTYS